ncbi:MAG: ROK family protein [Lentisphaerae bacterium]|nr:ROK family protein [Lentisphaerota bacterium]
MSKDNSIILGIDIGGTKTSVCVGSAAGHIHAQSRMSSGGYASIQHYRDELARLCASVMQQAGVQPAALRAAGISAPGPLDVKRGVLIAPPNNPDWRDLAIVELVRGILQVPVFFNNDGNACALAEYNFGAYRGTPNLVYLTFSTGMGGGIIANGQLIQGHTDTAAEVGHHLIDPQGPLCGCGRRGCWEAFVGGRRLAERLWEKIQRDDIRTSLLTKTGGDPQKLDVQTLMAAAREGDAFALAEWDELAERLAQGVGNLIMILNPQVVLLGTIAVHAGEFIMAPLRDKLPKYTWPWPLAACKIAPSTLGPEIGDMSALAVAVTALRQT